MKKIFIILNLKLFFKKIEDLNLRFIKNCNEEKSFGVIKICFFVFIIGLISLLIFYLSNKKFYKEKNNSVNDIIYKEKTIKKIESENKLNNESITIAINFLLKLFL
jgi:hypothetical protein